ncbi:hypothetical protein [Lichenibacterium dinghuense]|uniref:hypothetical protein n=1 Tax=Lichenibacterium dinghuense TaxID=2895977 RepID=UPI001F431470|nr:hypothetical protein [Lichenibacterium sp. 6Y81]
MTSTVDQLAAALIERADALPETAPLLAKMILDAAPDGDRLAALDLARTAYPSMFKAKVAEAASTVPVEESVSHMPVTMRVLREARGG